MRKLLALSALVLSLGATSTANASTKQEATIYYNTKIERTVEKTQALQKVMGVPVAASRGSYARTNSMRYRLWVLKHWQRLYAHAFARFHHPPGMSSWLCIHHYEGSWQDTGDPYWGGLQMDISFQQHYGPWLYAHKGTADHWTPLEQIWTAIRASHTRGFWPWPNTARHCGLL